MMRGYLEEAILQDVGDHQLLSTLHFSGKYECEPKWAIGPFQKEKSLTFKLKGQWSDPLNIGWKSGFLFNASLIEHDGKLFLFYRAAPKKETLCSRIGVAMYVEESGWSDYGQNPLIYPTADNEIMGCEDPKIYRAEGQYFMFYNGVWPVNKEQAEKVRQSMGYDLSVGCDIKMAVSDDLLNWRKGKLSFLTKCRNIGPKVRSYPVIQKAML